MKESNQRILAYSMATKIEEESLKDVSAAGATLQATGGGGYQPGKGIDVHPDVVGDFTF